MFYVVEEPITTRVKDVDRPRSKVVSLSSFRPFTPIVACEKWRLHSEVE
jgi:hypothetical protein